MWCSTFAILADAAAATQPVVDAATPSNTASGSDFFRELLRLLGPAGAWLIVGLVLWEKAIGPFLRDLWERHDTNQKAEWDRQDKRSARELEREELAMKRDQIMTGTLVALTTLVEEQREHNATDRQLAREHGTAQTQALAAIVDSLRRHDREPT